MSRTVRFKLNAQQDRVVTYVVNQLQKKYQFANMSIDLMAQQCFLEAIQKIIEESKQPTGVTADGTSSSVEQQPVDVVAGSVQDIRLEKVPSDGEGNGEASSDTGPQS